MPTEKPDKQTEIKWGKDPANYKLWGFYYNKVDKRVWINNLDGTYRGRFFIMNFSRPLAYIFALLIILIVVAIAYLTDNRWQ
jgi:uncharacterized membrane protein